MTTNRSYNKKAFQFNANSPAKALFMHTDIQPNIFTLKTARYCVNEQRAEWAVIVIQPVTINAMLNWITGHF